MPFGGVALDRKLRAYMDEASVPAVAFERSSSWKGGFTVPVEASVFETKSPILSTMIDLARSQ